MMWTKILALSSIFVGALTETTVPGIDRILSDGVKSRGYSVIYGDEDLTVINEVVTDLEKSDNLKNKIDINESIPPLPAQDVKCLMSVDRYCSKDMGQIKGVLVQAVSNDCQKCTTEEKERAGKVIASMMAHDPVAWKLFLTRYDGLKKIQRILG
uniref:Putative chemosensory protein 9 n=1 Tax=Corcyra cephalonica TaxID=139036 RepID=A0A8K1UB65_CORCP|nr:putative chemosensory protein 9 [Corcyra cephalonica]